MDWLPADEQLRMIKQGAEEIIPEDELVKKLQRAVRENRPLRVKQGFDPTAPDIHLGHTIGLRKLKCFQALGHQVVLIVGDYTGMVGDPSGRSEVRPQLSHDVVIKNAKTYEEQFFKIVDKAKTEVRFNGEWFGKMSFTDVMKLASTVTVARLLERDDFSIRFSNQLPIGLHELYYPVMQAYDSVAVHADVEIGATEQKFNLLMGRHFQQIHGQEPQVALTLPVLTGIDGVQRMSKSTGNYVGVTDPPVEMFGKLMSIPDSLVLSYFELLTDILPAELEEKSRALESAKVNPRDIKGELAERIVKTYHGAEPARRARQEFDKVFRDGGVPDDAPVVEVEVSLGKLWIITLLKQAGLAPTSSEGRRLVRQGAVEINGTRVADEEAEIELAQGREILVKVGKRRFARVRGC